MLKKALSSCENQHLFNFLPVGIEFGPLSIESVFARKAVNSTEFISSSSSDTFNSFPNLKFCYHSIFLVGEEQSHNPPPFF